MKPIICRNCGKEIKRDGDYTYFRFIKKKEGNVTKANFCTPDCAKIWMSKESEKPLEKEVEEEAATEQGENIDYDIENKGDYSKNELPDKETYKNNPQYGYEEIRKEALDMIKKKDKDDTYPKIEKNIWSGKLDIIHSPKDYNENLGDTLKEKAKIKDIEPGDYRRY
ncbi:MAG: hypothetical protein ACQEP1_05620 [Nanobdellota archaeon]